MSLLGVGVGESSGERLESRTPSNFDFPMLKFSRSLYIDIRLLYSIHSWDVSAL